MPRCRLASCLLFLTTAVVSAADSDRREVQSRSDAAVQASFERDVRPFLAKYCLDCHNAEVAESGVRVDGLDGTLPDRRLKLWERIQTHLSEDTMPPPDEPRPDAAERKRWQNWIERGLHAARSRPVEVHGSIRRLTVAQYRNTLRDLLGIDDDFSDRLPPDSVSKEGFLNHEQTMLLSPLLLEASIEIAGDALDRCIVEPSSKPTIQTVRMELGEGINREPYPDELILGAFNHLLPNADFVVTQPRPNKPFAFEPFDMQTKFRFIEGYRGNDTVRGWREFDSIYHNVFACLRGDEGYPKGEAYSTVPEGLLLRPAIPSAEIFQVESTYGPKANFKISLRELPDDGHFRIRVLAAKYDDGLLLDSDAAEADRTHPGGVVVEKPDEEPTVNVPAAGIYQVDVLLQPGIEAEQPRMLRLQIGKRRFSGRLQQPAFLVLRLPAGPVSISARYAGKSPLQEIRLTPLADNDATARRFAVFEKRVPQLGVHLGLRRDCGSTLTQVGRPQTVSETELSEFVFEGAIRNFPSPDVEKDNVNYLAGIREIGVRSEYTDGRDLPRLLIRAVEFEGPYHETWPPESHRRIFIDTPQSGSPEESARAIVDRFATRAFRRPVTAEESELFLEVWRDNFAVSNDFRVSVKQALQVILTSPQFLFLIETSRGPEPEDLDDWELASKLSYFLWNGPPDETLLQLAAEGRLRQELDREVTRMIGDPRFGRFLQEFGSQWLSLDKLDVVEIDRERFPRLTRDTRTQLRAEPVEFLRHVLTQNLPVRNLIRSDVIVANEVVASYYGLGDRTESGFEFVPIAHDQPHLGGLLTQAGILAGLSDGRHPNPIKRGAWFARKIIAEPPDDPPPNVPALADVDDPTLTLRETLERHRDQKGCSKCHAGIDPWGIPLEEFDAGGLLAPRPAAETESTLADGTLVANSREFKTYLENAALDQVAWSFLLHLGTYGVGRTPGYKESGLLREQSLELRNAGSPAQDLLRLLIHSDLFLKK